jgi:DNA-directed RNA polymerase specialized sigma24 family protein
MSARSTTLTDEDLLSLSRPGDQNAFTRLYDRYSPPLYRNIYRFVKNEDIAKELLQDLFLKI